MNSRFITASRSYLRPMSAVLHVITLLLTLGITHLHAQQAEGNRSLETIENREALFAIATAAVTLPERSAWSITFTGGGSTAYPKATLIHSVKTGRVQRDTIKWASGKTSESWWIGSIWTAGHPEQIGFLSDRPAWPEKIALAGWIDQASLLGIRELQGRKVIVFETKAAVRLVWPGFVAFSEYETPEVTLRAAILLEERRLWRVSIDELVAEYQWLEPPGTDIVIPDDIHQRIRAIQRVFRRTGARGR